jgi:surface polysaccharide O-acyltransferase-like enzyme
MLYGDPVRVLGTVAVVLGHVCDMAVFGSDPQGTLAHTSDWWIYNILDCLSRWAVPVYIMLSGALLLDPARDEAPGTFYRKRLARLGVPLVFWSASFICLDVYYNHWHTMSQALKNLVLGQPYTHLHFIFRIAILYAFTPAFRIFVRHAPRPVLVATVCTLFAVWSADSVVNGFMGTDLSAFARFAPFVSFYLGGFLLREAYCKREHLKWHLLNVIGCGLTIATVTGILCMKYGVKGYPSPQMFLLDFLSPLRVPMALSAWIFLITVFKDRDPRSSRAGKLFAYLAPTTLGLYLIHPLFREILWSPDTLRNAIAQLPHMGFMWNWHSIGDVFPNVWLRIPIYTALVYLLSLGSVLLLMKIPFARRVVE